MNEPPSRSTSNPAVARRALWIAFSVSLVSLASLGLFVLFVDDHWGWTHLGPRKPLCGPQNPIDAARAGLIDVLLVGSFGVSHSLLARPAIKRVWSSWTGETLAGTFYAAVSTATVLLVVLCWQPLGPALFTINHPWLALGLRLIALVGWVLTSYSSVQHDVLALFGLREPARLALGFQSPLGVELATPGPYRYVRHPMMTGILIGLWSAPEWSAGRLLLVATMSLYIVVGTNLEERALLSRFGEHYRSYQAKVGRFFPRWRLAPDI